MLRKPAPTSLLCALWVCGIGATLGPAAAVVFAQEGHPLAGSWHGKWVTTVPAPNAKAKAGARTEENFALEINWDNNKLAGVFNPGRFGAPLKVVTLNPADGTVHMEVDIREGHVVADGKLDNPESGKRTIAGTWTQGLEKGEFKLTRD